jgi:hypothetical protein
MVGTTRGGYDGDALARNGNLYRRPDVEPDDDDSDTCPVGYKPGRHDS